MRLIFAGTPQIAADSLKQLSLEHEIVLVITRPDSAVGRKQVVTPSPVANQAALLGLPVLKTNSIRGEEIDEIQRVNAEVAVVVAFGALIPKPALEILPWWNLHFSLLPKWRGATPLQHSMMMNEGVGISLFELEVGLDTGPIIVQQPMTIGPTETAGEALARFTSTGTAMILDSLKATQQSKPQTSDFSLAPKIARSQAKLDFTQTASRLAAKINALNPEPMAWAEISGEPIRLLRAVFAPENAQTVNATMFTPGDIWLEEKEVLLGCGHGTWLQLLEVQPAGKKAMSATDWFRGITEKVKLD